MAAHGLQKLTEFGPSNFGEQMLGGLGVPLPVFMAYVVTFVELFGGILLILGLLSRLTALLLTIDLVVAVLLVKVNVGLLSGSRGTGAELDLALIAGSSWSSWRVRGGSRSTRRSALRTMLRREHRPKAIDGARPGSLRSLLVGGMILP